MFSAHDFRRLILLDGCSCPTAAEFLEKDETLIHCFTDKIVDFWENVRTLTIKSL